MRLQRWRLPEHFIDHEFDLPRRIVAKGQQTHRAWCDPQMLDQPRRGREPEAAGADHRAQCDEIDCNVVPRWRSRPPFGARFPVSRPI